MDKYNTSHCLDVTAALAVAKADRDIKNGKTTKKRLIKRLAGLTYKIGEVYLIRRIFGQIIVCEKPVDDIGYHMGIDLSSTSDFTAYKGVVVKTNAKEV